MPIRAVIFDFGDILVRTEDPSGQRKWDTHLGLPEEELATIVFGSEVADRDDRPGDRGRCMEIHR